MPDENKIETPMDAVVAALESEEQTPGTSAPDGAGQNADNAPNDDTTPDAPTGENGGDGAGQNTDANANADEELVAPTQVRGDFAKEHWGETPNAAKKEIIRLAEENEKNYRRAAEAEYNAKRRREVLKPVMGYVKQTAEQARISEDEVIRNSMDVIQALNDNPTQTARQMIGQKMIVFDDPVAVIDTIAKTYGLDIKHDYKANSMPDEFYKNRQSAIYNARQSRYAANEPDATDRDQERLTATTEFLSANPELKARLEQDNDFNAVFLATLQQMVQKEPYVPYGEILNRAAAQFVQKPAPQMQTTIVEKKAKVVAPQKSMPQVSKTPDNPTKWTPQNTNRESSAAAHNAVLDAMRSLGLDE